MSNQLKEIETLNAISAPDINVKRKAFKALENELKQHAQVDVPLNELNHAGVYCRSVIMPAGTLITGKVHLFDHIEIMASGTVVVTTDDGTSKVLKGFNIIPAFSGKKRAFYTIEDTNWLTFNSVGDTGTLTCDEISNSLTVDNFEDFDVFNENINRLDYKQFVSEVGLTEKEMRKISENTDDIVDLDLHTFGVHTKPSLIEGDGIFSSVSLLANEFVMPARLKDKRTQAGRFTNHAMRPNCRFVFDGDNMNMIAIKSISAGEELTVNYREVLTLQGSKGYL